MASGSSSGWPSCNSRPLQIYFPKRRVTSAGIRPANFACRWSAKAFRARPA